MIYEAQIKYTAYAYLKIFFLVELCARLHVIFTCGRSEEAEEAVAIETSKRDERDRTIGNGVRIGVSEAQMTCDSLRVCLLTRHITYLHMATYNVFDPKPETDIH